MVDAGVRYRMRSLRLLALACVLPLVAFARSKGPVHERAEALSHLALQTGHSPRSAAALVRLHALRDEVTDLSVLSQTYALLVSRSSTEPTVRALAHLLLADVERARGNLTRAGTVLEAMRFVQRFYVVGGFDNEGKAGCDVDWGPESAPDLKATYPAKSHEVGWQNVPVASLDGYVDLGTMIRPNTEAVAYALTFLEAPAETKANLVLGTSGAHRLWVNGHLVSKDDRYHLPRPEQSRVQVRLRRGVNRVLLKVCHDRGPFGFYLRQEKAEPGLPSAKVVLPDVVPPLEKGPPPQPVPLPSLTELLAREAQKRPDDAYLLADYATVLGHLRAFDDREHTDAATAEKAAELLPNDAALRLTAGELQRDDHNLRRKHLEAAVKAAPENPFAALSLAEHEMSVGHPERALPVLRTLVERHPELAGARLAESRALEQLGDWPGAVTRIEEALRALPHHPRVLRVAASASRRLERLDDAVARYRTAIALRYDDTDTRRALAALLADLGRVEDAAAQLQLVLKLDPFDNLSRLRLAELYAANGRPEEAARFFAEAKALSLAEPEVHEREGRALLHLGRRDEAIAAFRRSLALRPQNPALKEVLRSLEGDDQPVGTPYVLDAAALEKEADTFGGEDAVYLVDNAFVRVQPTGLSSRFHQLAVKVFSQRGVEAFRSFPITYSPDRQEVRVLKARVRKPDGSVVDSYGENDRNINEPWTGMYYDARAKVLSFPALEKGDVLELQYRLEDTARENLLSDYWGEVESVQSTSPKLRYQFLVDMPSSRKLYWNKSRLPPGISVTVDPEKNGRVLYRFTAKNVPRVVPEPAMPGWAEVATTLHVSTYRTWDDVGRYYWGLVRDQLTPNEELKRTVDQVLRSVDRKDPLAVVRAIYGFVVTNTRYVALEFGIHGYKPYRVDRVLARRFGDCKDKASLMHAMLKVAGLDSRLVLLRMRHLGDIGEEPASLAAFNHAILYVPSLDLYLDGTAEFHGSRELPSADRAANVLIVEPDGPSAFRTTPEARPEHNTTTLSMELTLKPDGSASANGTTVVRGEQAPEYRRAYQAPATRKATFEQAWAQSFPGLTVKRMSINDPTRLEEDVQLSFALEIPRYAEALPDALRFHPFGTGRSYAQAYAPLAERRFDLVMRGPWVNSFKFTYALPPGFTVAELPEQVRDETPFGRFHMSVRAQDGKLVCEGELAFTVARVKAADYPAFRAWLGRVDQAFSRRLLAKKTAGQTAAK